MPEFERSLYKELPPEQGNARFRDIYYELPQYRVEIPMFRPWVKDVVERRDQEGTLHGVDFSQFVDTDAVRAALEDPEAQPKLVQKARLLEEAEDLISFAHITDEFRRSIQSVFEMKWEMDILLGNAVAPEVLFDEAVPNSGGIWVPERAVVIERQALNLQILTGEKLGRIDDPGDPILNELRRGNEATVTSWKRDFIQVHGVPA